MRNIAEIVVKENTTRPVPSEPVPSELAFPPFWK